MTETAPAAICGKNASSPPERMGCGGRIATCAEVYRCVDCETPFHKACLHHHCKDDLAEVRAQLATTARERDEVLKKNEWLEACHEDDGRSLAAIKAREATYIKTANDLRHDLAAALMAKEDAEKQRDNFREWYGKEIEGTQALAADVRKALRERDEALRQLEYADINGRNITIERDGARQEIERLKLTLANVEYMRDATAYSRKMESERDAANARIAVLETALSAAMALPTPYLHADGHRYWHTEPHERPCRGCDLEDALAAKDGAHRRLPALSPNPAATTPLSEQWADVIAALLPTFANPDDLDAARKTIGEYIALILDDPGTFNGFSTRDAKR